MYAHNKRAYISLKSAMPGVICASVTYAHTFYAIFRYFPTVRVAMTVAVSASIR